MYVYKNGVLNGNILNLLYNFYLLYIYVFIDELM